MSCEEEWKTFLDMSDKKMDVWLEALYIDPLNFEEWGQITTPYGTVPTILMDTREILITSMCGFEGEFNRLDLQHEDYDKRLLSTNSRKSTALHLACYWSRGSIGLKLIPLMSCATLDLQNVVGLTALGCAASRCPIDIVKALVNARAKSAVAPKPPKVTDLVGAIKYERWETVQYLLCQGVDLNEKYGETKSTALHNACAAGMIELVEFLLDHHASPKEEDELGSLPIHYAASQGDTKSMKIILDRLSPEEQQMMINHAGTFGYTPIIIAQTDKTVEFLLSYNADLSLQDEIGLNAIENAIYTRNFTKAKLLLQSTHGSFCITSPENANRRPVRVATPLERSGDWAVLKETRILEETEPVPDGLVELICDPGEPIIFLVTSVNLPHYVELLLEFRADPNSRNRDNETILYYASSFSHVEIVRHLLSYGADVNRVSPGGLTALHVAVRNGHLNVTRRLLAKDASTDGRSNNGMYSMHYCKEPSLLGTLLQNGVDLTQPTRHETAVSGETICHFAAAQGNISMLRWIHQWISTHDTQQMSIFNGKSSSFFTPLGLSIMRRHVDSVNFLVDISDLSNTIGHLEFTPLHYAAEVGDQNVLNSVFQAFQRAEISTESRTPNGYTPLMIAVVNSQFGAFQYLLDHNADVLQRWPDGIFGDLTDLTILMVLLLYGGRNEYIEELLHRETTDDLIRAVDGKGHTTLHYCFNSPEMAAKLLNAGLDINALNNDGETALHVSGQVGLSEETYRLLLENGADHNLRDFRDLAPLYFAVRNFPVLTSARLAWTELKTEVTFFTLGDAVGLFGACFVMGVMAAKFLEGK